MNPQEMRQEAHELLAEGDELLRANRTRPLSLREESRMEWVATRAQQLINEAEEAEKRENFTGVAKPMSASDYPPSPPQTGTGYELRSGETFVQRATRGRDEPELRTILRVMAGLAGHEERDALSGLPAGTADLLLPSYTSASIIDRALEESALVRAGATRVAMQARTHTLPRVTSDPTLTWRPELGPVAENKEPGLNAAVLTAKSVAGVAVISRELLEDAGTVGNAIERSLARGVARAIDAAALAESGAPVANGPLTLFADAAITLSTTEFEAAPYTWDCLIDIAAAMGVAEAGPLDWLILPHGDIAGLRKLKESTAGGWLGMPPTMNTNLIGSAQMSATAARVLAGSGTGTIAIGMLNEIRIEILKETYAVNHAYTGGPIGGGIGFLVWCRADVVAVDPQRLLRVPTDRTP